MRALETQRLSGTVNECLINNEILSSFLADLLKVREIWRTF